MKQSIQKLIGSAVLLTASIFTTPCAYSAPMKDETINKMMELSNIKAVLKETTKELKPMFDEQAIKIIKNTLQVETLDAKQQDAANKISNLMSKMTSEITEDPKFYEMIKSSYRNTFTEDEALANIAFLETPIGQSINKKSVNLMADLVNKSQAMSEQALQDPNKREKFLEEFNTILKPLLKD
ncbi:DUF2059 domain-containing protein [Acinetobacter shaoyimingii]|uniref:DUF2059 domain-containing protein n=1 Tax=Acinetobacter shaoyimingii TaxID=2715164 RepID=A0A6G8RSW6_9GAMM|nr:DUF2059 domain-containing protein [Acinetobacter shaoyimingii]NHB56508.1 DUF2059 domain-containing protein [Acinetobacter shaoyimingii]QIO04985.1 DUF2059 domain-containing protein [Acinetobacter shaoyimingii]